MTQPNWQTRFDELIDNEWWTIDDPDARSMTRTTSKIKQFLAQELHTAREQGAEDERNRLTKNALENHSPDYLPSYYGEALQDERKGENE